MWVVLALSLAALLVIFDKSGLQPAPSFSFTLPPHLTSITHTSHHNTTLTFSYFTPQYNTYTLILHTTIQHLHSHNSHHNIILTHSYFTPQYNTYILIIHTTIQHLHSHNSHHNTTHTHSSISSHTYRIHITLQCGPPK